MLTKIELHLQILYCIVSRLVFGVTAFPALSLFSCRSKIPIEFILNAFGKLNMSLKHRKNQEAGEFNSVERASFGLLRRHTALNEERTFRSEPE